MNKNTDLGESGGDKSPKVDIQNSEEEDEEIIDKKIEGRALMKYDTICIGTLVILYLLAYLDRANIGNAQVATPSLPEELNLTGNQFNVATSILFVTYLICEVPTNLILKKVRPSRLLSFCAITWSLVTIFGAFIENYAGLLVMRLFLGAAEGGLFPGITLYISITYKRDEMARRMAYILSGAISGAFGGLLATLIFKMNGVGGKSGWRWLFIIEGLISIIFGIISFFTIPDDPTKAWFLNEKERHVMRLRQRDIEKVLPNEPFEWAEVWRTLKDWKVWLFSCSQFFGLIMLYGFSTFLPTILNQMGFDRTESQFMTIPVYLWGSLSFIAAAMYSDRLKRRGIFLIVATFLPLIGYSLLIPESTSQGVKYFACYLIVSAIFLEPGTNLSWLSANSAGHVKRATSIGLLLTIANSAGIVAGQIYTKNTAPRYLLGHGLSLASAGMAIIIYSAQWALLYFANRKRDQFSQKVANGEVPPPDLTLRKYNGDGHPDFRYMY